MLLDLARLADGRLAESFRLEPGSPVFQGFAGDIPATFDLEVTLRHPAGGTYVLDGRLTGSIARPCRRCLTPVELDLEDRFRVIYQVSERDEEAGDDDIVLLDRGTTRIDLTEIVRDRLFLGVEEYPVCDPGCAGICPCCGQDLNTGSCSCEPEPGGSPWVEALQAVRDRVR